VSTPQCFAKLRLLPSHCLSQDVTNITCLLNAVDQREAHDGVAIHANHRRGRIGGHRQKGLHRIHPLQRRLIMRARETDRERERACVCVCVCVCVIVDIVNNTPCAHEAPRSVPQRSPITASVPPSLIVLPCSGRRSLRGRRAVYARAQSCVTRCVLSPQWPRARHPHGSARPCWSLRLQPLSQANDACPCS
jgi:hypothetical protein